MVLAHVSPAPFTLQAHVSGIPIYNEGTDLSDMTTAFCETLVTHVCSHLLLWHHLYLWNMVFWVDFHWIHKWFKNWRTALRRFLSWKCCWCLRSLPRTIPSALFSLKHWLPSGFDHWNLGKHFSVLYFSTVASSSLLGHLRETSDSLILSLVSSFF